MTEGSGPRACEGLQGVRGLLCRGDDAILHRQLMNHPHGEHTPKSRSNAFLPSFSPEGRGPTPLAQPPWERSCPSRPGHRPCPGCQAVALKRQVPLPSSSRASSAVWGHWGCPSPGEVRVPGTSSLPDSRPTWASVTHPRERGRSSKHSAALLAPGPGRAGI